MKKRTFLQEFKSMLFDYKVIYIFLSYVIISSLLIIAFGYKPMKDYYMVDNVDYTDEIDKLKEQYHGMKYEDIEKEITKKADEVRGYINDPIYYLEKVKKAQAKFLKEQSNPNRDGKKLAELEKEYEIAKQEQKDYTAKINTPLPEEKQRQLNILDGLLKKVQSQISNSKTTPYHDKQSDNQMIINKSDIFYDWNKEGLLLGFGNYFGKNFHFIAWMNAFVLELFLGGISYFYIRKRKNNSIENGDIESYKNDKKNIILSFICISLIMAVFMLIRHFAIVNIKYPRETLNPPLKVFLDYYTGNAGIKTPLIISIVLSMVYYIARPIIYAKRSEVLSHKKSMIYFIALNLLMYVYYFGAMKHVFIAITGIAFLSDIVHGITLASLIIVAVSSYKSFMSGEKLFKRRKEKKLAESKKNKSVENNDTN